MCRVPSGTAGRVECRTDRKLIHDAEHARLVIVEQAVAPIVVARRPVLVAALDVTAPYLDTGVIDQLGVVHEAAYLGQASLDDLAVILPRPTAQQRGAFDTD